MTSKEKATFIKRMFGIYYLQGNEMAKKQVNIPTLPLDS